MSQGKFIKKGGEKITAGLSSGIIVDQYDYQAKNIFAIAKNHIKTRMILNQTEGAFLDFKKKHFADHSKKMYEDLLVSYKKKDKLELMSILSEPLFNMFKISLKEGTPLPMELYKDIRGVSLAQARIYSLHKHHMNPSQTWHQMTMKFIFHDPELKQDVIKHHVFERREADASAKDWRICYLE